MDASYTCCASQVTAFTSRTRSHITVLTMRKRQENASLSPSRLAILSLTTESESPQRRWYTTSEEQTQLQPRRSQTLPFCYFRERGEFECCRQIRGLSLFITLRCVMFSVCLRIVLDFHRCWFSCLHFQNYAAALTNSLQR